MGQPVGQGGLRSLPRALGATENTAWEPEKPQQGEAGSGPDPCQVGLGRQTVGPPTRDGDRGWRTQLGGRGGPEGTLTTAAEPDQEGWGAGLSMKGPHTSLLAGPCWPRTPLRASRVGEKGASPGSPLCPQRSLRAGGQVSHRLRAPPSPQSENFHSN